MCRVIAQDHWHGTCLGVTPSGALKVSLDSVQYCWAGSQYTAYPPSECRTELAGLPMTCAADCPHPGHAPIELVRALPPVEAG